MSDLAVQTVFDELRAIVGPAGFVDRADVPPRHWQDLWGGDPRGRPALLLRPASTEEVSRILAVCDAAGVAVVPQGGMTGLVSAGVPSDDEVALSLERMDRIEEIDLGTRTMTVQAGATLQEVQEAAAAHGLAFPLDLAPRGSCTVGGFVSTNAGGNRVLLYGMTRELVLSLEAVLADGTVLSGLHKLAKNNAGYDLKQLFIGTEGTLGVVTRAVLRLRPLPTTTQVALCALSSFDETVEMLHRLQAALPGMLSAYEVMWQDAYRMIMPLRDRLRVPLPDTYAMYVLVEAHGSDPDGDRDRFLRALAGCVDLIEDAAVAADAREAAALWAVRENVPSEVLSKLQPLFGFDISLPIGSMETYLGQIRGDLREIWPDVRLLVFGHLGDGNVHIAVVTGERTKERKALVEDIVYRRLGEHGGSISAEHGIGFEKRPFLHYSRTPEEIAVMRRLKQALDPAGILSPGRIFPAPGEADGS